MIDSSLLWIIVIGAFLLTAMTTYDNKKGPKQLLGYTLICLLTIPAFSFVIENFEDSQERFSLIKQKCDSVNGELSHQNSGFGLAMTSITYCTFLFNEEYSKKEIQIIKDKAIFIEEKV